MGGDQEREEELVVLVDVPPGETRQHHAVAQAGDRKRLGDALGQPEDDRLEVGDGVHGRDSLWIATDR